MNDRNKGKNGRKTKIIKVILESDDEEPRKMVLVNENLIEEQSILQFADTPPDSPDLNSNWKNQMSFKMEEENDEKQVHRENTIFMPKRKQETSSDAPKKRTKRKKEKSLKKTDAVKKRTKQKKEKNSKKKVSEGKKKKNLKKKTSVINSPKKNTTGKKENNLKKKGVTKKRAKQKKDNKVWLVWKMTNSRGDQDEEVVAVCDSHETACRKSWETFKDSDWALECWMEYDDPERDEARIKGDFYVSEYGCEERVWVQEMPLLKIVDTEDYSEPESEEN